MHGQVGGCHIGGGGHIGGGHIGGGGHMPPAHQQPAHHQPHHPHQAHHHSAQTGATWTSWDIHLGLGRLAARIRDPRMAATTAGVVLALVILLLIFL